MFNRKYAICFMIIGAAGIFGGCTTVVNKDQKLREIRADLDVGNYDYADLKTKKILKDWDNNHNAMVLQAEAKYSQGNARDAIEVLTRMDRLCHKDLCPNETKHIEGLMLLAKLTTDEELIKDVQERLKELQRHLFVTQYDNEVHFYIQEGRPQDAADVFDRLFYDTLEGNIDYLSSEQKMKGFVLYYSTYQFEKARKIYKTLTLQQRSMCRDRLGGKIRF